MAELLRPDGTREPLELPHTTSPRHNEVIWTAIGNTCRTYEFWFLRETRQVLLIDEDGVYKPDLQHNAEATRLMHGSKDAASAGTNACVLGAGAGASACAMTGSAA